MPTGPRRRGEVFSAGRTYAGSPATWSTSPPADPLSDLPDLRRPAGQAQPRLLKKGPFRAVRVYPGDLGTKGGLLTDEHARVLREDGTVIPGLYAAGNTTASVMGRTYPGPGSTIGPVVVFGYRAARHPASR
jgi:succinate dehydrogenase/fumarate reductase flavoprotein subunit